MLLLLVATSLCDLIPCDLCTLAVKGAADGVAQGISDSDIIQAVTEACPSFPLPYSAMCETLVGQLPDILTAIPAGLSPETICADLRSCSARPRPPRIRNSRTCGTCKAILKTAKTFPEYPPDKLVAAVVPFCDGYSGRAKDYCLDMATVGLPLVLKLQRSSDEICTSAEFCGPARRPRVVRQTSDSLLCDFCVALVGLLEDLMKDQKIDEDIAALVEQFCQGWPAPIPVICISLVDEYVPIILQLLEAGLEHLDICTKIGLCSSATARRNREAAPSDPFCDFCQSLVNMVINWLADGKTRDEIRELADEACQDLPYPYSSLCAAYVNAYIDQVIDWIEEGIEELNICQRIGLCAAPKTTSADDPTCDICRDLVHYIELLLQDGKILEDIVQLAEQMCQEFPWPLSTICQDFVDQDLADIINLIDAGLEATDVCADLGYCPAKSKRWN